MSAPGPGVRPSPGPGTRPAAPRASKLAGASSGLRQVSPRQGRVPRKDAKNGNKEPLSPGAEGQSPTSPPPPEPAADSASTPTKASSGGPPTDLASLFDAMTALSARCDKLEASNAVMEQKVGELEADAEATSQQVYELGKKAAAAAVATSQAVGSINKSAQNGGGDASGNSGASGSDELLSARLSSLEQAVTAVKEVADAAFAMAKNTSTAASSSTAASAAAASSSSGAVGAQLATEHSTHFSATMDAGTGSSGKTKAAMPKLSSSKKSWSPANKARAAAAAAEADVGGKKIEGELMGPPAVPVLKARAAAAAVTREKVVAAMQDDREEWEKALDGDAGNGLSEAKKAAEEAGAAAADGDKGGSDTGGDGGGLSLRERLAMRRGSTRDGAVLSEVDAKVAQMDAAEAKATGKEGAAAAADGGGGGAKAKVLELSEEEKAMNGAPEGELFVVEVLPRDQLPSIEGGVTEAKKLLADVVAPALNPPTSADTDTAAAVAWNVEFDALTALRRVLRHASQAIDAAQVRSLLPGVERCARNLRSVLAKNALLCCADLFLACRTNEVEMLLGTREDVDVLVGCLLDACASNAPKALRVASAEALTEATSTTAAVAAAAADNTNEKETRLFALLAPSLAGRSGHKNKEVAEKSMLFAEKALKALVSPPSSEEAAPTPAAASSTSAAVASAKAELVENVGGLLLSLSVGLNGKSAEGKKAARACCGLLQSSFLGGDAAGFAAEADKLDEKDSEGGEEEKGGRGTLTALQVSELKAAAEQALKQQSAASAGSKAKKGIGKGMSSIKERMAQMRKSKLGPPSAAPLAVPEGP